MRKLLNTLFVTTQGSWLGKDGDTVAVRVEKETRLRLPLHTLEGIVCFGDVGCTPFLMGACGEGNIGLSFLTEYGRFLARVQGKVRGNVLLRRQQYRIADDEAGSANAARYIVAAKVANSCAKIGTTALSTRVSGAMASSITIRLIASSATSNGARCTMQGAAGSNANGPKRRNQPGPARAQSS